MENTTDSLAWLARRDGVMVIGHGPFTEAAEPPADGVAFHVRDFAMADPLPWKIPSRVERGTRAEFAKGFAGPPVPDCDWQPLDAAPFSEVFQEIMAAIHSGFFEKTVPVVTETGTCGQAPGPAIRAR